MTCRPVAWVLRGPTSPVVSPDEQHRDRGPTSTAVCRDRPKPVGRRAHRQCGRPACDRPGLCRRCGVFQACGPTDRESAPLRACGDTAAGRRFALLTSGPPWCRLRRRRAVAKRRPRWRTTGVRVDDGVGPLPVRTPCDDAMGVGESAARQQAEVAAAHHRLGIFDQANRLRADRRGLPLHCGLPVRCEEHRSDLAIRGARGSAV